MMDFAALPPDVNAARLYAGPGAGPLLAAATAWDQVAAELRSAAAGYTSALSRLTSAWQGPASAKMIAAAGRYASWMTTTAAQTEHTAQQIRVVAAAYEAARAATVPPQVVAANRAERQTLIATNVLGQNTGAIAGNDARYAGMWSQNAAAMHGYAAQAGKAGRLPSFTPPPQVSTAADPAAATSASTLPALVDGLNSSPLGFAAAHIELLSDAILPANSSLINTIMGLGMATKGLDVTAEAAAGGGLAASLTAGLDSAPAALPASAGTAVSAGFGRAGSVGGLSVPTSWAASTPAIRTVASVLSGTAESAVSAAAVSRGSLLSTVAAAGAAGSALGASAPNVAARNSRRGTASTRTALKDGDAPQDLQRLVAEMAENPDSVQHWHTDSENLDALLAALRQQPGTHAVHLKNGKSSVLPPRSAL